MTEYTIDLNIITKVPTTLKCIANSYDDAVALVKRHTVLSDIDQLEICGVSTRELQESNNNHDKE